MPLFPPAHRIIYSAREVREVFTGNQQDWVAINFATESGKGYHCQLAPNRSAMPYEHVEYGHFIIRSGLYVIKDRPDKVMGFQGGFSGYIGINTAGAFIFLSDRKDYRRRTSPLRVAFVA